MNFNYVTHSEPTRQGQVVSHLTGEGTETGGPVCGRVPLGSMSPGSGNTCLVMGTVPQVEGPCWQCQLAEEKAQGLLDFSPYSLKQGSPTSRPRTGMGVGLLGTGLPGRR